MPADPILLEVLGLRAGYGDGDVLHGVDVELADGELLAVLGPNGAGKSSLLRAMAGFVAISGGSVALRGRRIDGHDPAEIARCGLYLVPERRAVFPSLSVADNLRMATAAPEKLWRDRRDLALELFPRLGERWQQVAGTLSGGEQQMLALARAVAADPTLLLLDEPSLGLAPHVVDVVFAAIERFRATGVAIVLVEQYVQRALAIADRVVVLGKGEVVWAGSPGDTDVESLGDRYLGTAQR